MWQLNGEVSPRSEPLFVRGDVPLGAKCHFRRLVGITVVTEI